MAYTKYSLTPANNTATPPDGAPEGMLPSAVNDTMRDMMAQIRDCGDGIRDGTYTMTAPKITGGTITGAAFTGNTFTSPVISGGSINNTPIGATTANTGAFTTLSATGVTTVQAGTVSAPAITTSGDTNTGIFFPAADTIAFTEGGVESMRIDSSGNVLIGQSSLINNEKLLVRDNIAASANARIRNDSTSASAGAAIAMNASGNVWGIECGSSAKNSNALTWLLDYGGTNAERLRLNTDGTLILRGGSTSATGTGITFPATQSASSDANTLDDYEEGTWTPVVNLSSSAPTVTYVTQFGSYTKVGRMVTVTCNLVWSAASGGSGDFRVSGLPFATANTTSQEFGSATFASDNVVTTSDSCIKAVPNSTILQPNTSYGGSGVGSSAVTSGSFNKTYKFTLTYFTA